MSEEAKPSQATEGDHESPAENSAAAGPLQYGVQITVKVLKGVSRISTARLCLIMGTVNGSVLLQRGRNGLEKLPTFSYTNEILKELRAADPEYLGGLAPVGFTAGPEDVGSVACFVGMRAVRSYEVIIPDNARGMIEHALLGLELGPGDIRTFTVRYRAESSRLLKACVEANTAGTALPRHPKPIKPRDRWSDV